MMRSSLLFSLARTQAATLLRRSYSSPSHVLQKQTYSRMMNPSVALSMTSRHNHSFLPTSLNVHFHLSTLRSFSTHITPPASSTQTTSPSPSSATSSTPSNSSTATSPTSSSSATTTTTTTDTTTATATTTPTTTPSSSDQTDNNQEEPYEYKPWFRNLPWYKKILYTSLFASFLSVIGVWVHQSNLRATYPYKYTVRAIQQDDDIQELLGEDIQEPKWYKSLLWGSVKGDDLGSPFSRAEFRIPLLGEAGKTAIVVASLRKNGAAAYEWVPERIVVTVMPQDREILFLDRTVHTGPAEDY
eukprot:TRINITY_DN19124_c0_g1_i1.p1 TRINITY_DN19124_c0_g1~~TRINITY_DN19124_c0_g1_i1.p1  ORF type:complete len:301 (+),score=63.09 TRINITY_DN19124_c0_g1_i1:24-926(+)